MSGITIAVTGASGMIGRKLLQAAAAQGRSVVALSRHRPAKLAENIEWRPLDLAASSFAPGTFHGVDRVVHLASVICGESADQDTLQQLWGTNVLGTRNLIAHMAQAGIGRLVLASTANFYDPRLVEATEGSPIEPISRSLYLSSKAAQEWNARSLCDQKSISFAALRISSVVGCYRSLLDQFARQIVAGHPVTIANRGTFGADFVALEDVVKGILLALDDSLEGAWNLSSGKRTLLTDVAADLAVLAGREPDKMIIIDRDGQPDIGFPAICCEKLRSRGYEPLAYPQMLHRLLDRAHVFCARS